MWNISSCPQQKSVKSAYSSPPCWCFPGVVTVHLHIYLVIWHCYCLTCMLVSWPGFKCFYIWYRRASSERKRSWRGLATKSPFLFVDLSVSAVAGQHEENLYSLRILVGIFSLGLLLIKSYWFTLQGKKTADENITLWEILEIVFRFLGLHIFLNNLHWAMLRLYLLNIVFYLSL